MLNFVLDKTDCYLDTKNKTERKKIGQFFTSKETAKYMASLFEIPKKEELHILDPGAGTGILSIALIDRLQSENNVKSITLTCYENNEETAVLLEENLQHVVNNSVIPVQYEIKTENYILSQYEAFNNTLEAPAYPVKYDLVIGNPPYLKILKGAPEALAMPQVCYGAPNLYFLFATMSLFNLTPGGEMVYIIPRSWTSGAYFKQFRNYLLSEGKLLHLHLFVSRDKVFDKESVLQETIIIKIRKQKEPVNNVIVTSSNSNSDFNNLTIMEAPYSVVVSGTENYVFLVTSLDEIEILEKLDKFPYTLQSFGLKIKTGLTVDFRTRELLRQEPGENNVPLFYSQNIKDGKIVFPADKEYQYISNEKNGLIQKNKNYLFIKRFTSKEEKRRLQCGIYLAGDFPEYSYISTQNKLNFIDYIDGRGLSKDTVFGLYVLYNSTLYDSYYRILNGSTQVNATEINAMPVPSLDQINVLGEQLQNYSELTTEICDMILEVII